MNRSKRSPRGDPAEKRPENRAGARAGARARDRSGKPAGDPPGDLPDDLLEVGYVARAHGIRGELRVVTHDPTSTTLLEVDRVVIAGQSYRVRDARPVTGAALLALDGVADRDRAAALRGQAVAVDRALIPLADDEFFLVDLVGCQVVLGDGTPYGVVAAIDAGPQDRLVIHADPAGRPVERLLPLVPDFVESIDLDDRRIVVTPPEDLPESPR